MRDCASLDLARGTIRSLRREGNRYTLAGEWGEVEFVADEVLLDVYCSAY